MYSLERINPFFLFQSLIRISQNRVEYFGAQYTLFGGFALFNYIMPFFMWDESILDPEKPFITMRIVAGVMSFLLLIKDLWPVRYKAFLPSFWHLTLLFCFPFITTFMLLETNFSFRWLINVALALFLLSILVDWLSFGFILALGVIIAIITFMLKDNVAVIALNTEFLQPALYLYTFTIIIGLTFSRNQDRSTVEKLSAMKSISGSVAHELRTPLASVTFIAYKLKELLPRLSGVNVTRESLAESLTFREKVAEILAASEKLENAAQNINHNVNILLKNLTDCANASSKERHSMARCIHESILQYPSDGSFKLLMIFDDSEDFLFRGDYILVQNIFFNLLKNSFYQIKKKGSGKINIRLQKGLKYNKVYFTDTGPGISKIMMRKMFSPFVTETSSGAGLGLTFCKNTLFVLGGYISCSSIEGKETTFTLTFPSLES